MFITKNIKCCTDRNSIFNYSINLQKSVNEIKYSNNMNQELPINKPQYYNEYSQDNKMSYNYNNIIDSKNEELLLNSNYYYLYMNKCKDYQKNFGLFLNNNNNKNNSISKNSNKNMNVSNSRENSNSKNSLNLSEKNKNNINTNFALNNNEGNIILRNIGNNFNDNSNEEKIDLKINDMINMPTNRIIDLDSNEDKSNKNTENDKKNSKIMDRIKRARAKSSDNNAHNNLKSENILMKAKLLEKFIGNIYSHEKKINNNEELISSNNYANDKQSTENPIENIQLIKNKKKKIIVPFEE